MPAFPRDGRIKRLNEQLEEARSDASLLRAGHMRLLQTLSERDQAVHEQGLAVEELRTSRDQVRLLLADRLLKHGVFEISFAEQETAFRHADQVQILPDEEAKVTRFSLLEGVALRELPKPKLAAVPAPNTSDTEPRGETDPNPGPGLGPRAVEDPDESKEPS